MHINKPGLPHTPIFAIEDIPPFSFSCGTRSFTIAREEISAIEKRENEVSENDSSKIEQISKDLMNNGVIPNKEEKKYNFDVATKKLYQPQKVEPVEINSLIKSLNEKFGDRFEIM